MAPEEERKEKIKREEKMQQKEELQQEEEREREEAQQRGQREFRQHLVGQRFVRTPITAILAEVAKSCQDLKPLEVPVEIPVEAQGPVWGKEPGWAQAMTRPRAAAAAAVHERKDIALRR